MIAVSRELPVLAMQVDETRIDDFDRIGLLRIFAIPFAFAPTAAALDVAPKSDDRGAVGFALLATSLGVAYLA